MTRRFLKNLSDLIEFIEEGTYKKGVEFIEEGTHQKEIEFIEEGTLQKGVFLVQFSSCLCGQLK